MGKNKNFEVGVKLSSYNSAPYLFIRRKGYQWGRINIDDPKHEIPVIIKTLEDYYKKLIQEDNDGKI